MLKTIRHTRFWMILSVIVLLMCMTTFMQFHHHDCKGNMRVSIVENCKCHHFDNIADEHWPDSSHHAHGCEGGCCNGSISAILTADDNDTDQLRNNFIHLLDFVAVVLPDISSIGHSPLELSTALLSGIYIPKLRDDISVYSLRGPPSIG